MRITRNTLALGIVLMLTFSAFGYFFLFKPVKHLPVGTRRAASEKKKHDDKAEVLIRLSKKAITAKEYAESHHFNTQRCFLIDMRIPSGEKRFFVYNLDMDSIEVSGLVTHGSGVNNHGNTPSFSNVPNSNCTSLGKYKVGKAYQGRFGLAYKLYGLENTNSKAFERFVVLHSHECVPDNEVSPQVICESWGCPTVAPAFLTRLQTCIDESPKPILLWIYY